MKYILHCHYCRVSFESKDKNTKFCGRKCDTKFKKYHNEMYSCVCIVCKKDFKSRTHNETVCPDCIETFRRINSSKFNIQKEKHKHYFNTCINCNKEFRTISKDKKYCSDICEKTYKQNNKKVYEKICPYCHKHFSSYSHNVKYCSENCRNKYYADKHKKEHLYRDTTIYENVSNIIYKILNKRSYLLSILDNSVLGRAIDYWKIGTFTRHLKDKIKDRDGWKCVICGGNINLHVHHILPRSLGGNNDEENLITLCSGCHRTVERLDSNGDIKKAIKICLKRFVKNQI